ncbi:penicillin-binding transpeptidase domain-containing protein [Saccharophagus degradans]|uniref:peptidoglycan D,D-transpeptidase FtsI family protein n=1 Tax=Saccharophagus degradans TaxID=86304 RepID=UPI002477F529|nr:penicillin-binding transpeptidase domain-containing protein [Saccharophagus degradans]WGO97714.1 penicillin-binding transpeptidase domain-containing protein [Saccharophagus degradans]
MKQTKQIAKWRMMLMGGALCALPISLIWHLANLQLIPGDDKDFRFLQSAGDARTLRSQVIPAYRGVITDRNGELLAVSTPLTSIYVNPQQLNSEQGPALAKAMGISYSELKKRLKNYENKQFMYLERHLPPHKAEPILAHKFKGVYSEQEYRRYYPAGEVTAHIIGFTDIEDQGQEGVELAYNQWLAGVPGEKRLVKDLKGNVVKEVGMVRAPATGKPLQLSIDLRLQYLAYRELKAAVAEQKARAGSLVMLDVETGEILAMVNQPSYNPNDRTKLVPAQLRNRALTDVFEPGSTMKPLTMMAALETGRYPFNHTINTSPGYIQVGSKTLLDPRDYGVMDLTKIITKSSQVGITKLALEMDAETIRNMFARAGLGQSTGLGFPGESVGVLPSRTKWRPIEHANLSFGYGLNLNAVQLAQAYNMIAAGGEFKPVSLVMQSEAPYSQRVVSERVTSQITTMLKTVTQQGGTATRAQIPAFPVAGKSGTAHKTENGGYADDRYRGFFAGFAPADNPKIVAVVVIDEPSNGKYYGGESAAPVFAKAVGGALQVLRVPPVNREEYLAAVELQP